VTVTTVSKLDADGGDVVEGFVPIAPKPPPFEAECVELGGNSLQKEPKAEMMEYSVGTAVLAKGAQEFA
jgi:hypothetical protein